MDPADEILRMLELAFRDRSSEISREVADFRTEAGNETGTINAVFVRNIIAETLAECAESVRGVRLDLAALETTTSNR